MGEWMGEWMGEMARVAAECGAAACALGRFLRICGGS